MLKGSQVEFEFAFRADEFIAVILAPFASIFTSSLEFFVEAVVSEDYQN